MLWPVLRMRTVAPLDGPNFLNYVKFNIILTNKLVHFDENRRVVRTIKEAEGTILGSQCSTTTVFLIEALNQEQRGPTGKFGACNLSEEFRIDGARVVFSGYLYEQFETENICAVFFEITEIRSDD